MKYSKSVQLEAIKFRGEFNNTISEQDSLILIKLAREHCKLQEYQCNRELTKAEIRREATIETKIKEILKQYYLIPHFVGDPRSFTVKVHNQDGSGPYNTWGGQTNGYGIGEYSK